MATSAFTALLLGAFSLIWLYWLWRRRHFYRFALQFPTIWGLPLLGGVVKVGSVNNFLPYAIRLWRRIAEQTILFWFFVTPTILTKDPKVVEQVLTGLDFVEKSTVFYAPMRDTLKGGMIVQPFKEAQYRRKIFGPTIRSKPLLNMLPIFNAKSKEFLTLVEQMCQVGGAHKMLRKLRYCTLMISKETTMGHTVYKEPQVLQKALNHLVFIFHHVFLEMVLNCAGLRFILLLNPVLHWKRRQLYALGTEIFTYRAKNFKTEELDSKNTDTDDIKNEPRIFIDQALKYYGSGALSWDDIIGEANIILVASFETTSSAMYSILILLAMHAHIQERVYEEILANFPHKDFEAHYEDLKNLTYLEMVINESLRLFPPAPLLAREVTKDTTLMVGERSYTLPKHMHIVIDVYNIHRDPNIWGPQAKFFNPDNFLPHKMSDRHAYGYLPFSKGSRNCVGMNYAYVSMKILLSHILRNYSVHTTCRYEDLRMKINLFLEYKVSPLLTFKRRN